MPRTTRGQQLSITPMAQAGCVVVPEGGQNDSVRTLQSPRPWHDSWTFITTSNKQHSDLLYHVMEYNVYSEFIQASLTAGTGIYIDDYRSV